MPPLPTLSTQEEAALHAIRECWLKRIAALGDETPTSPLYHYTSTIGAVEGILKQCQFRFTDMRCMNDKTELRYGLQRFRRVVRQECNRPGILRRYFLSGIRRPSFTAELFKRFRFYSTSFGVRDNAHMWKRYGRGGKGVAIGIDQSVFGQGGDLNTLPELQRYFAGRVRYQQTKVRKLHREFLRFATEQVEAVCGKCLPNKEFLGEVRAEVFLDSVTTSLTSKKRSWSREQENRLFFTFDLARYRPLPEVHRLPGVAPFIIREVPKVAFVEVLLGPSVSNADRVAVAEIVAKYGHTAKITPSALPPSLVRVLRLRPVLPRRGCRHGQGQPAE